MLIILMRHGTAEDGINDKARELTGAGREECRAVARALDQFGVRPSVVLSSHRVRAIQTAELVIDEIDLTARVEKHDALDCDRSWDEFAAFVNQRLLHEKEHVTVLCCGHQPQLGRLVRMATEGREIESPLKKGSATGIRFKVKEIVAGKGKTDFYITPDFSSPMLKKIDSDAM